MFGDPVARCRCWDIRTTISNVSVQMLRIQKKTFLWKRGVFEHKFLVQFQDLVKESQNWATCLQCRDSGLSLSDVKLLPHA